VGRTSDDKQVGGSDLFQVRFGHAYAGDLGCRIGGSRAVSNRLGDLACVAEQALEQDHNMHEPSLGHGSRAGKVRFTRVLYVDVARLTGSSTAGDDDAEDR
jgi:hypothetical protein